jgi:hypothetical protein
MPTHTIKNLFRTPLVLSIISVFMVSGCKPGSGDSQESDPVVIDRPVAYIQRPLPKDDSGNLLEQELLSPATFNPGAQLFIKERATSSADTVDITAGTFADGELYDVKDLSVSSDGNKLIFSMRAPDIDGLDDDEQPKWNIWEYDLANDSLRRIITSDIVAEEGHDISPAYLPDGRILFSSTRQRRSSAILLDDGKPQYSALDEDRDTEAFVLHVMEEDGSSIRQITYNQSHDLHPTILDDGRIAFLRWDNFFNNNLSLYTVNPDGTNLNLLYGYHSQNTGSNDSEAAFQYPKETPDGRILVSLKSRVSSRLGGNAVLIDTQNYIDNTRATDSSGATGPAQSPLTDLSISTDDNEISIGGNFHSVYPFGDGTNRLLTSWSQCRVINPETGNPAPCTDDLLNTPDIQAAEPLYGLWIHDLDERTQLPLVPPVEGQMFTDPVTMEPVQAPTYRPDPVPGLDIDQTLFDEGVGVLHIRSVYDMDGVDSAPNIDIATTADPAQTPSSLRTARFLRIVKAVSIPNDDVRNFSGSAFGRSGGVMREILGYVPIEPDGSVKVKIPAEVAFTFDIVDQNGWRISDRHSNWLQLMPGEERNCKGCHEGGTEPHGRADAGPDSVNFGNLSGFPFPNTLGSLLPNVGESMAETWSRINGPRTPSVDMTFTDDWTDSAAATVAPDINLAYSDLSTPAPVSESCQNKWTNRCRILINYVDHIQPLWDLTRTRDDGMGGTIDMTCSGCHSTRDDMNNLKVPDADLDLTSTPSAERLDYITSFAELLFNDNKQELDPVTGLLIDELELVFDNNGDPVYELNEDGTLRLDSNGDPIQVTRTITVRAPLNPNGAARSTAFFNAINNSQHQNLLSDAELKLISEWLDIGAQYYNNPFDAPLN